MRKYIKIKQEEYWHWESKCSNYPESKDHENVGEGADNLVISFQIPRNEELCPECIQIEADEKIKLQSKEMLGDDNVI